MTSTSIGPVTSNATWDLRAPGVDEPLAVTVASASHAGDQDRNADVDGRWSALNNRGFVIKVNRLLRI